MNSISQAITTAAILTSLLITRWRCLRRVHAHPQANNEQAGLQIPITMPAGVNPTASQLNTEWVTSFSRTQPFRSTPQSLTTRNHD